MNRREAIATGLAGLVGAMAPAGASASPDTGLMSDEWFVPTNRYVTDAPATEQIQRYTENPDFFQINAYSRSMTNPKWNRAINLTDNTPYAGKRDPVVLRGDKLITPKPPSGVGFTHHLVYPFDYQPTENRAEHATMAAARAMTVRTLVAMEKLKTVGGFIFSGSDMARYLWPNDFITAVHVAAGVSPKQFISGPDHVVVMNPNTFKTAPRNLMRRLSSVFSPDRIIIEKSVFSESDITLYSWPDDLIVVLHVPTDELKFNTATLQFRFMKRMVVETDENGHRGRVIEDFHVNVNPDTGFRIMV